MISACQYGVQQNADDPGGRVTSGPGVQIPAAAPNPYLETMSVGFYRVALIMPPSIGIIAPLM